MNLKSTFKNSDPVSLLNKPTCKQFTNTKHFLKLSCTFETGLFDHQKVISTNLKTGGFKEKPKEKYIFFHVIH